jgi:tetratricopeptide (TPR) repeat protein
MASREDADLRERADRALRAGKPAEALPLYGALLRQVRTFEPGLYEGWLEAALTAYQRLGRSREAGYALLALRRFSDAERLFDPEAAPVERAICASKQGRRVEAGRALAAAGLRCLATVEFIAAGDFAAARLLWEAVLADPRLRDRPYETALACFSLGQVLQKLGDEAAARKAFVRAQQLLEGLADDFESQGERDRALDCTWVLLRLGKDTGAFENVAEGYLNAIRLLKAAGERYFVLQYYEDFIEHASRSREWHAAASLAGEAAEFSQASGLVFDRHYRQRALALWTEAARDSAANGAPAEVSEAALCAALDAAAGINDTGAVGRIYAALAALPLPAKKQQRYQERAGRYPPSGEPGLPGPVLPEHLRRGDAYQDVWQQDLIEWELDGRPLPTLALVAVERIDHAPFARQALRALLHAAAPEFALEDETAACELALLMGGVRTYEVLRPLERLFDHPAARVRAAVLAGAGLVPYRRSFGLVRRGIADPEPLVRDAALRAMRALHIRDGLDTLKRFFRESTDDQVHFTAIETIADIGTLEAGLFLLDVIRQEPPSLRDLAARRLQSFPAAEVLPLVRQAAAVESGPVRDALDSVLSGPG